MNKENEEIKRAHSIEIRGGADTKEDLVAYLEDLIFDLKCDELIERVTGAASHGGYAKYIHNPKMTHDKYMEAISGK